MSISIKKYEDRYHEDVLAVWEASVRATHLFLPEEDIVFFRSLVHTIDFHSLPVYCALNENREVIGFLGVSGSKLEMLFLKPEYMGKGIGKQLMKFAFDNLGVNELDVNEDNANARAFYKKFGFRVKSRRPLDDCGKPYPILNMKLVDHPQSNPI